MAKKKLPRPERTDPMQTQPSGHSQNEPTPMLPSMPHARDDLQDLAPPAPPPKKKKPPTEAEAALAQQAEVTRRTSLRRQRAAQKR
jgi:hypothetical protein